ncbi:hypothetical protein PRIPAC_75815 [Pristionchus pacificus]|uniref:GYF domain-containing protein n=1 Tax=Pristionchus pacificus TaxID=54126 RepID=A0A2A6B594_PRIPA|nr:hypothetical protein PRIPAC_75815 [Pristionchus pacificus]|eukprot:PDM61023.1 hypothetical protein PRIPAC_54829 [Pristionchus pacificus]
MGTETPNNFRIFFKDKKNELKGPYNEREVQEWYREKWFENSFPFYFMKDDEVPNDKTPFLTLGALRSLNGIGCPFNPKEAESKTESMEEKLARLEKDLADLSVTCEGVKELEKRLAEVEKKLETFLSQSPASKTDPAPAAAASPKAPRIGFQGQYSKMLEGLEDGYPMSESNKSEDEQHLECANTWWEYFLDMLEMYKTRNTEKLLGPGKSRSEAIFELMYIKVFESEAATAKCREVMLQNLKSVEYVYCAECDVICQSDKQILLHIYAAHSNRPEGQMQMWGFFLQTLIEEECKRLKLEELKTVADLHAKYSKLDASTYLFPKLGFVDEITQKYGDAVCDYVGNINSNRAQIVTKMMPRLKQDRLGRKMMGELHEHIGSNQTRCYDCKVVTGTREEYYKHVRTHAHLVKAKAMDLITLVVNMYKKD